MEDFKQSLRKLTINSKQIISSLTESVKQLAKNVNKRHIIQVIITDTSDGMLMLYLTDSIMRTIGGAFVGIISQEIASIFRTIFKNADFSTRGKLVALRKSWNQVLSEPVLFKIDRGMDLVHLRVSNLKNCL